MGKCDRRIWRVWSKTKHMKPDHPGRHWILFLVLLSACGTTAAPVDSPETSSSNAATDVSKAGYYAGHPQVIPLQMKDTYQVIAVQQVLGIGDRCAGNEYGTSQALDELSIREAGISLLAAAPGNDRLNVTIGNHT